jgi:signal transduction histidine kinase
VQPEPQPTLTVEDTGRGIAAEEMPHVFERFYRGDTSRARGGGAGLGLSIARWIATAHDARITLHSHPGSGTRASVAFPRVATTSV